MRKNILFRVDSSIEMGSGHVMRCLTLASALRSYGANIYFICRDLPGNMISFINSQGFLVEMLPYYPADGNLSSEFSYEKWLGADWQTDAEQVIQFANRIKTVFDWIIVDHYSLDLRWEKSIVKITKSVFVIDDLANRHHFCDCILDQNLSLNMYNRYSSLVPEHCIKIIGPQYALLREEFKNMRDIVKVRNGPVKKILVFLGGSDPDNITEKAIRALKSDLISKDIHVDIVVGIANPLRERIREICFGDERFEFHCQINNMAQLMAQADLAIGAGGSTSWERCCLGLPTIVVNIADNQKAVAKSLAKRGAIVLLSNVTEVSVQNLAESVIGLQKAPDKLRKMSLAGFELVDGLGIERVLNIMRNACHG